MRSSAWRSRWLRRRINSRAGCGELTISSRNSDGVRTSASTSLAARAVALRGDAHFPDKLPDANPTEKDGIAIEFSKHVDPTAEQAENTVRRIFLSEEDLSFGEMRASHFSPFGAKSRQLGRRTARKALPSRRA